MSVSEAKDLSKEAYREYVMPVAGGVTVYRIEAPRSLWVGTTTHRVLDAAGVVHCLPAPGVAGTALRWQPKDASEPVQF
jgi:hypothetical protein